MRPGRIHSPGATSLASARGRPVQELAHPPRVVRLRSQHFVDVNNNNSRRSTTTRAQQQSGTAAAELLLLLGGASAWLLQLLPLYLKASAGSCKTISSCIFQILTPARKIGTSQQQKQKQQNLC